MLVWPHFAEAQLANRLAVGDELRAAASALGITYGTARTRLVEVLQKTNTHRQGELVGVLLAIARLIDHCMPSGSTATGA